MNWTEFIVAVLSGLAAAIPLVINLVKYVQKAVQEKNWGQLVKLVTNLMEQAEGKFDNGSDRKKWVLAMVQASADTINYDVDIAAVGELIDSLCDMTKIVNAEVSTETEAKEND